VAGQNEKVVINIGQRPIAHCTLFIPIPVMAFGALKKQQE